MDGLKGMSISKYYSISSRFVDIRCFHFGGSVYSHIAVFQIIEVKYYSVLRFTGSATSSFCSIICFNFGNQKYWVQVQGFPENPSLQPSVHS